MSEQPSPHVTPLPMSGAGGGPPARHETVLPDEPAETLAAIDEALRAPQPTQALRDVAARHPACLDAWARLGQRTLRDGGHPALVYAFARVGYHRGLDRLRKHGWGGTGLVRWSHEGNRGFLRSLHLLLLAAAAVGEVEEAERCRRFLLDLDPDDGIGASAIPELPGPDWSPPAPLP